MKSEIIKLRKQTYEHLKRRSQSFETPTKELTEYLKAQVVNSQKKFSIKSMDDLKKRVLESRFIFLGDFHTFDQNIRNVLRIVKYIITENKNCVLGLEMIDIGHQFYLDTYMEGHLTDLEFLELINYHDSWRFPWTHYKLIFDLAKEYNIKVHALNSKGTLLERDRKVSQKLKELYEKDPKKNFIVFFGELHITPNKMPKLVKERIPNENQLIIHQNLDHVYWELNKIDLEQGIVSFSDFEYCIVSAPPWIKYESMIYWYENLCDDPDFDIHEYIIENGKKFFSDDTHESFSNISQNFSKHLQLQIDEDDIEDYNLYDHTNLDFIQENLSKNLPKNLFNFYKYLIETNKSFRLPHTNQYYCSSYSMNRMSYISGVHLFYTYIKDVVDIKEIQFSKSKKNKFFLFVYEALFGHFFSKIINPHRKCPLYLDIKNSQNENSSINLQAAEIATSILDHKKYTPYLLQGVSYEDLYETALLIGHLLGEYLYLKVRTLESISLNKEIKKIKLTSSYFSYILNLALKDQDYKNHQKRYF